MKGHRKNLDVIDKFSFCQQNEGWLHQKMHLRQELPGEPVSLCYQDWLENVFACYKLKLARKKSVGCWWTQMEKCWMVNDEGGAKPHSLFTIEQSYWRRASYTNAGVFGRPVTRFCVFASQRPSFFSTSTLSKRLSTLRFWAPLLDLPKLGCLDIAKTLIHVT